MKAQPCSTVRAAQGLSASEIEHIATRSDQQVLSADDDEVLHRERLGDLTELVLAERDGNPTDGNAVTAARREAHMRELDALRRAAWGPEPFDFDGQKDIPTIAASARAIRQSLEDVLSALEDVLSESEIGSVLAENGVSLPRDHVDRKRLAVAIARAGVRAHEDVLRRLDGAPIETPLPVAVLKPAVVDQGPQPTQRRRLQHNRREAEPACLG